MEFTTTLALNLTFLATLGIGFLLFLCHVGMIVTVLILTGIGRLMFIGFQRSPS